MADGLLKSIPEDDRMLGLLGIGLGMLANARGRDSRQAFQNALGGGAEGGMSMLGPIMQAQNARAQREAQARQFGLQEKQFGLQERSVGAQEELNKMHAKLYGAQVADLERTQQLIQRALGGMGGAPAGLSAGPDGTQIGVPGAPPPIQSRGLNDPAPLAQTGQPGGGTFNIPPALITALSAAKPQMAAPFMEMWKADQPKIEFVGGIPVDARTGRPIAGAPTLPQMSQPGLGYQNIPDPSSPTGFRVVSPPGAMELLALQKGTAAGAEAAATAPYGTPRVFKLPDGREMMMTPDQFTQFARGGGTPAPISPRQAPTDITGAPVPSGMPSVPAPRPGTPEWAAFDAVRRATGPATATVPNIPGLPGIATGMTNEQQLEKERRGVGATQITKSDEERVTALEKQLPSLMRTQARLNSLRDLNANDKTYAASGAELKRQLGSIAQGMGLDVAKDKTANTEVYIAHVAELLKDRLASKDYGSGSGVSNLDLLTAERPLPELSKTREGRARIIDAIEKDTQRSIMDANSARDFFDKNNYSLRGFRFPSEATKSNNRTREDILREYGVK